MAARKRGRMGLDVYKEMIFGNIPPCVRLEVWTFLDAEDLIRLGLTCRSVFKETIGSEYLWVQRCRELWADKAYVPKQLQMHPSLESYFHSKRAANDASVETLEKLLPQACFHMRMGAGTMMLFGFEDATGRKVPMFRRFAEGGKYVRYPDQDDVRRNPYSLSPVKDPVERHEELHGPLLPGHALVWSINYQHNGINLANLPPLRISRRADNWAWRLENEFLVYETCSRLTLEDQTRLDPSEL